MNLVFCYYTCFFLNMKNDYYIFYATLIINIVLYYIGIFKSNKSHISHLHLLLTFCNYFRRFKFLMVRKIALNFRFLCLKNKAKIKLFKNPAKRSNLMPLQL
jgi:hypothetical protein